MFIKTGISGLDFLLGGGIFFDKTLSETGIFPTLEIKGPPGSGKTTMALQIITSILRQKNKNDGFAFATEQPIQYYTKSYYDLHSIDDSKDVNIIPTLYSPDFKKTENKCNLFLINPDFTNFDSFNTEIYEIINNYTSKNKQNYVPVILIDSLSSIDDEYTQCQFLQLKNYCSRHAELTIFINDDTTENEFNFISYYCDIVFSLKYDCSSVEYENKFEYNERTLEILKARHQYHYRGKHNFSINGSDTSVFSNDKIHGINIFPSMAARLSVQSKKHHQVNDNYRYSIGIADLDDSINGKCDGKSLSVGSSNLLIGERGTSKKILGSYFLFNSTLLI